MVPDQVQQIQEVGYDTVELYWNELVELKTQICYHVLLRNRDNWWDMMTKVVPALTSSVGLIAWLVKQSDGFYWAILIAASHVLVSVKHLFPFEVRRSKTFQVDHEFSKQFLILERNWGKIVEGELTKDEILAILFNVKDKLLSIEHKHLSGVIIPRIASIKKQAEKDASSYLAKYQRVACSPVTQ